MGKNIMVDITARGLYFVANTGVPYLEVTKYEKYEDARAELEIIRAAEKDWTIPGRKK